MRMQKKDKQLIIFFAIFVLIGIASIAYGITLIVGDMNFKKTAKETMATITEIQKSRDSEGNENHKVHVKFSADDKEYDGELGFWNSGMKKGQDVKVHYNPGNPWDFRGDAIPIGGLVVIPIGALFFLIGFAGFIVLYKQQKRNSQKIDNKHYEDPRRNAAAMQKKSERSTNTIFFAVLALFILVSIGVIAGGIALIVKDKNFKKTAKETMAVVTEIYTYRDSDSNTNYRIYVKFSVDGEEYEGQLSSGGSGRTKGQEVKIYYNPDDPQDFNEGSDSIAGFILIPFGTIFLIFSLVFLRVLYKDTKYQNNKHY